MHRSTPRLGFTLVELVVVMGIIGVLMLLGLPAIHKAVEGSRRNACAGKQMKFALAMARHDVLKSQLPGWRNNLLIHMDRPPAQRPSCQPDPLAPDYVPGTSQVSWFVTLLPLLERNDVFQQVINGDAWKIEYNEVSVGGILPQLTFCPSTDGAVMYSKPTCLVYKANAGSSGVAGSQRDDGAISDNFSNLGTSLGDIRDGDGLASTLLTSEFQVGYWASPKWVPQTMSNQNMAYTANLNATTAPLIPAPEGPGWWESSANCYIRRRAATITDLAGAMTFGFRTGTINASTIIINNAGPDASHMSSWHPLGAYASFADGSTRFISEKIRPHVYGHLITKRSVWDASTNTYSNNSPTANVYLKCPPAPATTPYTVQPEDY